jgi:periplasmic copper chaperone A
MIRSLLIGALVLTSVASAAAHVTLEAQEANIGMPYKAVLRVPHGCEGSATVALRVRIPDGVIAVKPMPKPGWMLTTNSGKYSKTYTFFHNAKLSEGVTEITWSGGKLPDAWYD